MMRIEPRQTPSRAFTFGVPIISALMALLLAAIPLAFTGVVNIAEAYAQMAKGIFGSVFSFSEMLTRATPLIFTGLAATMAFRAKLWNIGAEGQFYLGAMAAVAVGTGLIDGTHVYNDTHNFIMRRGRRSSRHGGASISKNPFWVSMRW